MHQLTYDSGWVETSHRHPESLTVLAPESLQYICRVFGGTHGISREPNFRLVLCSSRYQLAGGHAVTILDDNGNPKQVIADECFLPRYHVSPKYHGLYVLEMWRSAEELWRDGYGFNTIEFDEYGNGVRCMEPVWADGVYEAVWNGPQNPFVFPRDVPTDVIEWAIWLVHLRLTIQADEIIKKQQEAAEAKRIAEKEETIYNLSQTRRVNCGEPFVSLVGT